MRTRVALTLFVLTMAACRPPAAVAPIAVAAPVHLSPAEIAARSTPSICSVRSPHGMGTGFVVDARGFIVTNLHVIAGQTKLVVVFSDKRELPVLDVVAYSERHDLAVLRVDSGPSPLVPLPLGNSDALRAGDPIVAIGHPLGLEDTVSNGLVSAIRKIDDQLVVLQISAPIAPGSSGGPILDERGDVIGVATAFSKEGQNLGFGMPARYIQDLLAKPSPVALEALAQKTGRRGGQVVKRDVPHHDLRLLEGCSDDVLTSVLAGIGQAIDIGAPLYNEGKIAACYHIYEGTAQDLERRLPSTCKGPVKALSDGRARAASLQDPDGQAWAMRDAFDGLLEVILLRRKTPTL